MAEKGEDKKPSKNPTDDSSEEESLSTDLVSEIPFDEGSVPPPLGYQESPTAAGAEGIAVASAVGTSTIKTFCANIYKKFSPDKKENPEKAAKQGKTPQKLEKSPDKKESVFGKIKNVYKRLSPKKRVRDDKPSGSAAKISKYESAKMHGGFPKTKGELVLDSESSGVPTECTSLEASSEVHSPTEKAFPDKLDSPDKPASKEDSSDEDAPPEDK